MDTKSVAKPMPFVLLEIDSNDFWFYVWIEFKNGFKNTVSSNSQNFEERQRKINAILIGLSYAKNKGGGEASRQTLLDYIDEVTKSDNSLKVDCVVQFGSIFDPRNPLTKLQETSIDSYYEVLKSQVKEQLVGLSSVGNGEIIPSDNIFGLVVGELKMVTVREILIKALDDERSDEETKELSLRLLLKLGYVLRNSEFLLIAARYQKKLNIEAVTEIAEFDMVEVYEEEQKEIYYDNFNKKNVVTLSNSAPVS